jgi:hypothetical protein
MSVPLTEIKELSRNELVEVVAELWETRPGWRTEIVEPGDEIELEIEGDSLGLFVPQVGESMDSDGEVSIDILAIQEEPYVEFEYIYVHQSSEDGVIERTHLDLLERATNGMKVRKSIIVTTGPGPEETVGERLYEGHRFVEGAELCDLIEQYAEYGFDYNDYL